MEPYEKLLLANQAWVKEKLEATPDFFKRTADGQQPEFLWIGCSDSRVPAEEITGTAPGELFVHRNVANMVVHTDFNLMSVLQYAVGVLKVPHVIVCGHYGCGGVKAAMSNKSYGLINKWLRNIKDVNRIHREELNLLPEDKRYHRLVELNVIEQTRNLAMSSFVQHAWHHEKRPTLHGWVYDLETGVLTDLIKLLPGQLHDEIYEYDFTEPDALA